MNKFKKVIAALAAMSAMVTGTAGVIGNAEENVEDVAVSSEMAVMEISQQLDSLVSAGEITEEEAQEVAGLLADSEKSAFTPYEICSTNKIAPTTHHFALVPTKDWEDYVRTVTIKFCLNGNTFPIIGKDDFSNDLAEVMTVGSPIRGMDYLGYSVTLSNRGVTIPANDVACIFNVPEEAVNSVSSEYMLNVYSCENRITPNNITVSGNSEWYFYKLTYAMGDVNRDGEVNIDDGNLILKRTVGLMTDNPNRTDPQQKKLDKIAFDLAADYDKNGTINVLDYLGFAHQGWYKQG